MRITTRLGGFLWRPLTASDADTDFVLSIRNHDRFRPWFHSTVTRESHLRFLQRVAPTEDVLWIVEDESDNSRPIGVSSIYDFDRAARKAECGRIASFNPRMFPLNFTICATLMFEHLGLNKAYIQTLADNRIISRAVERLGMTREGVLRDHVCSNGDGQLKTIFYYGILAADWLAGERARQHERYGVPEVISIEQ